MIISISRYDIEDMVAFVIAVWIVIALILAIAVVVCYCIRRSDDTKPLISKKVRVLEKPTQNGNIEWYIMECVDGQRLKLRSFQASTLLISVGDVGIVTFRGETIQRFDRTMGRDLGRNYNYREKKFIKQRENL